MHTADTLRFAQLIHQLNRKNPKLGLDEFVWMLNQLDVTLAEADYRSLFAHFQANWNEAKVDWTAFVSAIYTQFSPARAEIVRKAYEKMDPTGRGEVTLDCVARTYNVNANRDVTSGLRSAEQHYHTFMSLWGLDFQDAPVSFSAFTMFWENVSPAFESDKEFVQMVKTAFAL